MAVHDAGDYHAEPLRPGVVFALDPQMWVPEERLYVRVEDTVAITNDGVEILTQGVPLKLDEIEALMRDEGILQAFPPTLEEERN
jgi:Xaa-Pro aminopeptidase